MRRDDDDDSQSSFGESVSGTPPRVMYQVVTVKISEDGPDVSVGEIYASEETAENVAQQERDEIQSAKDEESDDWSVDVQPVYLSQYQIDNAERVQTQTVTSQSSSSSSQCEPRTKDRMGHPDDVNEDDIDRINFHDCPLCRTGDVYTDGWTQWCYACTWREEA